MTEFTNDENHESSPEPSKAKRHKLSVRVTAVGFVVLILFGNFWLVDLILGTDVPIWIGYGFYLGLFLAIGGGVATAGASLLRLVRGTDGESS